MKGKGYRSHGVSTMERHGRSWETTKQVLLTATLVFGISLPILGYAWTHSVEVQINHEKNERQRAYLWIPESCSTGIRGLIMGAHTSAEALFVRDQHTRGVAEEERLAIIYFYPSAFSTLDQSDTTLFKETLAKLAGISGFPEIEHAPWISLGHSTSSHFVLNLAWWWPERTFGSIMYKGGLTPEPGWNEKTIAHVPIIGFNGEFEEYAPPEGAFSALRLNALDYRAPSPETYLVGAGMITGEGHMGWSKRAAPLIALFIKKAAQYRIADAPIARQSPVTLHDMVASEGWLADTNVFATDGNVRIDTATAFDNPDRKLWLIDREFAEAWKTFHAEVGDKKKQSLFGKEPEFNPDAGVRKHLGSDVQPDNYKARVDLWKSYTVTGYVASGLSVDAYVQTGPGYFDGDTLRFNPCMIPEENNTRIILRQDGNEEYKPVDCLIRTSIKKKDGTPQQITIPESFPQLAIGESLEIQAEAGSGLPVTLWVMSGPGELDGNVLTAMPYTGNADSALIYVRAGQAGGETYATAEVVEFTVTVRRNSADAKPRTFAHEPRQSIRALEFTNAGLRVSVSPSDDKMGLSAVLIDSRGRTVSRAKARTANAVEIPTRDISSGVYLLQVRTEQKLEHLYVNVTR